MEDMIVYKALDIFFFVFHVSLIIFNLFGWIPAPTRKYNLVSLCLTAFSWFGLGIFYGFGYCFLTDWHWQVREALGKANETNSYIHFLIASLTGASVSAVLVDTLTVALFFIACVGSFIANRKWLKKKVFYRQ